MADATIRRNPYIIGRPISESELFFGRESLFAFIEDNLKQGAKVIVLHGQRRIGKSSVLSQIPNFVGQRASRFAKFKYEYNINLDDSYSISENRYGQKGDAAVSKDEFVFVPFDLQDKSWLPLSGILYSLATEIINHLELCLETVTRPTTTELEKDLNIFYHHFLPQVYQALDGKNLVLLLDEFDVLSDYNPDSGVEHFFPYIKSLLSQQEKLFIIPVIGRQLDDMPQLFSLFKGAPSREIGLLDEHDAERLITKPVDGILKYSSGAIKAIIELTSGHPYFTQLMCFVLFSQARDEQRSVINRIDVENAVDKAIESGEAGLAWFRDGLPLPERVLFSAAAEAQENHVRDEAQLKDRYGDLGYTTLSGLKDLWKLLQHYGVVLTEPLLRAEDRLSEWKFLGDRYKKHDVRVELVRRWLVKRFPLRQEIRELEQLDKNLYYHLYDEATKARQRGDTRSAIKLYEQVLEINPNYFRALFEIAEEYLLIKNFAKAVETYTRAYKVAPIPTEANFTQALVSYGHKLITQGNFELAKKQLSKALEIQPDNAIVAFLLWFVSIVTFSSYLLPSLLVGISLYFLISNIFPNKDSQLEAVEALLKERKYEECIKSLANISPESRIYTDAKTILRKCKSGTKWQNAVYVKNLAEKLNEIHSLGLDTNSKNIITSSQNGIVKLWNLERGKLIKTIKGYSTLVNITDSIAFSPDGKYLATGNNDGTVEIWEPSTGKLLITLKWNSALIDSVVFSPDGRVLVTGNADGTIKILGQEGKLVRTLFGHSGSVNSIAISSDSKIFITGGSDKTIKIWNLVTGELIRTLFGHSSSVNSIAISPDGKIIASGSSDKTIKIWNLPADLPPCSVAIFGPCNNLTTEEPIHTFIGHSGSVNSIAISPDGKIIASGSADKTIKIWDLETRTLANTLSGHSASVNAIAIEPDGKSLVSASSDGAIKIWQR
jgi:WD40 repeat protein